VREGQYVMGERIHPKAGGAHELTHRTYYPHNDGTINKQKRRVLSRCLHGLCQNEKARAPSIGAMKELAREVMKYGDLFPGVKGKRVITSPCYASTKGWTSKLHADEPGMGTVESIFWDCYGMRDVDKNILWAFTMYQYGLIFDLRASATRASAIILCSEIAHGSLSCAAPSPHDGIGIVLISKRNMLPNWDEVVSQHIRDRLHSTPASTPGALQAPFKAATFKLSNNIHPSWPSPLPLFLQPKKPKRKPSVAKPPQRSMPGKAPGLKRSMPSKAPSTTKGLKRSMPSKTPSASKRSKL
jgi:hypothetical protein